MKISLIHPSRGRAEKAKKTFDFWKFMSSGDNEIEHILSLDFSDSEAEKYPYFGPQSQVVKTHNDSVVQASNEAAKISSGQILVYLSDDFKCPKNWDVEIIEYAKRATNVSYDEIGRTPWILRVNDGHQPFENLVLTIPIMSRDLYQQLGYFFHPDYKSMWVDCDLYQETKEFMINAPDLVFKHEQGPEDETYRRSNLNFESGREIFNKRREKFGWENPFKISKHL